MVERDEHLPMAVRSLFQQARQHGLGEESLYVALWRSGKEPWPLGHGARPLSPSVLGRHAILVALCPESRRLSSPPGQTATCT